MADVAWVDYKPGSLVFCFAKKTRNNPEVLQSLLELRYPPEVLPSFWGQSQPFFGRLKAYVESWPGDAMAGEPLPLNLRSEMNHAEWVSFVYLSHSGSQGSLDWYHLSPTQILRYRRFGKVEGLKPRPVVRVQMSTFELHHFIERLHPIVDQIRQHMPTARKDSAHQLEEEIESGAS